jgi:hypothetical protein
VSVADASKRPQRLTGLDQPCVRGRQGGAVAIQAGVAIEQRELHGGSSRGLVLVLPVQIDERSDGFTQGLRS